MRKFLFVLFLCVGVVLTSCTEDESSPVGDVYGIVSDTKSGAPIRNAEVVISPSNASTVSGSDGHFEFKSLTPGQYKISVTANGYASNSRQVTVAAGQRISCDIHLTPQNNDVVMIKPTSLDFGVNELQLAATITNESDSETEWFLDLGNTPWLYAYPTTGRIGGGKTHSIVFTANRARMKEDKSSVVNISAFGDTHPLSLKCKQSVQLSSVMVVESLNVDFGEEATEQIIRIRNISETDVNWTLWGNDSGYLTMSATHGIVAPGGSQIVTISLNREELNEVLATTFKISDGTVDQPVNVIAYPTPEGATTTNKIFYTSIDGNIVEPNDPSAFLDANGNVLNIISNTYEYGQGIIVFDSEVDRIDIDAFRQCQTLVSITLPSKLTDMRGYIFCGCSNLVSINIPDGVTSIGNSAFSSCSGLTSITIPNGVTSIGEWAFNGCSGLTSIDLPNGITSIESHTFYNCSSLTSIDLPNGITSIGESAFVGCSSLTSIDIPDGVTLIGTAAFSCCSGLTSITIPDSVTSIGNGAFEYCKSLTSIDIPNRVTSIGEWAFISCSGLTSVNLGSGVTSIGDSAFCGCSGLTSITIGYGLTSIGYQAFGGCSGLTSIDIPDGVTSIGNSAFQECSGLTSITIPDGVTSIGTGTFEYCSSLTSVNLGSGVTSIGERAFNGCSGLTSINIPDGVTSIGNGAFEYCKSLTSIDLPNGITSIENGTFWCCFSLTSVNLGSGVTSIGNSAFSQCGLTSINIPDGVTSIGNSAFHQCNLTSIAIPENVTLIGEGAFSNCNWLTSVYCRPTTPPTLGADVFHSNASDRKIYVPTSSTDAYQAAENWSSYADAIVGYDF